MAEILHAGRSGELYAALTDEVERLIRLELRRFVDPATDPDTLHKAHIRASILEHLLRQWDKGVSALEVHHKQFEDAQDRLLRRARRLDRDDAGYRAAAMQPGRPLT